MEKIMDKEAIVRARAVWLILEGRAEEALRLLSNYYGVPVPRLRVGLPKKCRKALGCYVAGERMIYVRSSDEFMNPFVIMHEYYHHLRSMHGRHRGTERYADKYAYESIIYYRTLIGHGGNS